MKYNATRLPYRQTDAFSTIALDYIDQADGLKSFFAYSPSLKGIGQAIEARKQKPVNRQLLVDELKKQYAGLPVAPQVQASMNALLEENCFTITTAHQNNIFTGPLYFIYKTLHAVKLADTLKTAFPENNFVPVFYIGSEDADLEELNHIRIGSETLTWDTQQTGAVGRMKVDKNLLKLVERMEGQLSVLPEGDEIINLFKESYREGATIQQATFRLLNHLFGRFGLLVLIPDNAALKKQAVPVFADDLLNQTASGIVEATAKRLSGAGFKVQANPREINLFYLYENSRERIEKLKDEWRVVNTGKKFSQEELLAELDGHPERFSPNVILRGLYQSMILPDVAFIGGGGEVAYWLQLKELFAHYAVPFPVLALRNSFLIVEKKWNERINKLGFTVEDFFLTEDELLNKIVLEQTKNEIKLNGSLSKVEELYGRFKQQAIAVDSTLEKHVESLKQKALHQLQELEKKMIRAEKRKFEGQKKSIHSIKAALFPGNNLQERTDNFSYYYAKWGASFFDKLYEQSLSFEQEFVILTES